MKSIENPEKSAHSPGKLILSGEHSVLYGAPALAMAIDLYIEVWFKPLSLGEGIRTAFASLSEGATYPIKLLSQLKSTLDTRFDQFARGELTVQDVLSQPDDLAVYALATLLEDRANDTDAMLGLGAVRQLPTPGELGSRSSLPIGAGMGSSAAIVAAITILFENLLNRSKTPEERLDRVRWCERLKHGKAGPIDAASVVYGGLVQVRDLGHAARPEPLGLAEKNSLVSGEGWYWILHGRPASSTGDCVSAVADKHGNDRPLWDAFAACTKAFEEAVVSDKDPKSAISENHRLLKSIGVVPEATQALISELEAAGAAAKICGAGSISGDAGGAILVRLDDPAAMPALMGKHPDVQWAPLRMARKGASSGPASHAVRSRSEKEPMT
ncbi:MAG: GHMP kinase [Pseudomonadota bacterium]